MSRAKSREKYEQGRKYFPHIAANSRDDFEKSRERASLRERERERERSQILYYQGERKAREDLERAF